MWQKLLKILTHYKLVMLMLVFVQVLNYVDFDLVVNKFLINLQLQTSKSMVIWAIFLWQRWQKSLTNKFNFFSQVLSGVDEVLSNLDQPSLCFSLIRFLPPHTSSHCLCYGCGLKMYNALITIRKTFLVDCFQKDWGPPQKIARLQTKILQGTHAAYFLYCCVKTSQ